MNCVERALLPAAKQFDPSAASVKYLTQCRNAIYVARCPGRRFVLRLSGEQHRSAEQIESELTFQSYLYRGGADVAQPLQTASGKSCGLSA